MEDQVLNIYRNTFIKSGYGKFPGYGTFPWYGNIPGFGSLISQKVYRKANCEINKYITKYKICA